MHLGDTGPVAPGSSLGPLRLDSAVWTSRLTCNLPGQSLLFCKGGAGASPALRAESGHKSLCSWARSGAACRWGLSLVGHLLLSCEGLPAAQVMPAPGCPWAAGCTDALSRSPVRGRGPGPSCPRGSLSECPPVLNSPGSCP